MVRTFLALATVVLLASGRADAGYILELSSNGGATYSTLASSALVTGDEQTVVGGGPDFLVTVTWSATSIDLQVQTLGLLVLGNPEFFRATLTDTAAGTYTAQAAYTGPSGGTTAESWVNAGNAPGDPTANTTGVLSPNSGFVPFATSPFTAAGPFAVSTEVRFPVGLYNVDTFDSQVNLLPVVSAVPAPGGLVLLAVAAPFVGLVRRKRAA